MARISVCSLYAASDELLVAIGTETSNVDASADYLLAGGWRQPADMAGRLDRNLPPILIPTTHRLQ